MREAESLQRVVHGTVLGACEPDKLFEHGNFHQGLLQIDPRRRFVIKNALFSVEIPFSRRVQLLKNVLDEKPRTLVHLGRIVVPFGAYLPAAVPEPDGFLGYIYGPYLPLEVSPIIGLINVNHRFSRLGPAFCRERGGIEPNAARCTA